jgi:putative glycoside hydrolase with GxGYxYP motif/GxGYxY motif-containing protein
MTAQISRRGFGRLALGTAALSTAGGLLGTGTAHAARELYPKGVRPTTLHVLPESGLSFGDRVLAATLQGQLARSGSEGIYLNLPTLGYGVWLRDLADRYGVGLTPAQDVWSLVDRFRRAVRGYVLFREGTPSVNVATSLAGITGGVAVEESQETLARQHGLTLLADVRTRDDAWAYENHRHRLRKDLAIEQRADFGEKLRDYATMTGAFTFFDGNSAFRKRVVNGLDADASVIGWGDASQGEDAFVSVNSDAGVRMIAADHGRNLSVLSGIRADRVRQRPAPPVPAPDRSKHYVTFLVTDGDNIQWLLGDFQSDPRWYASQHRGEYGLGWGMSPTLVDLAPSVMRWYYDNAGTDRFVVGPSGGGYLYPSRYPSDELALHTSRLSDAMGRADLGVVQIIDFGSFDDTALWSAYLRRRHIEGLIYLEYSRYDTHKGRVVWANDKPVISARTMLWDGLAGADEASVTAELNAAGRDPRTAAGYSIVMWHAWNKSLDNVRAVVDNLAPHVRVVAPDTLVRLVAKHVRR